MKAATKMKPASSPRILSSTPDKVVDSLGHCIFCLEKANPSKTFQQLNKTLENVWPVIALHAKVDKLLFLNYMPGGRKILLKVPPMCEPCSETIRRIDSNLKEIEVLQNKIKTLRDEKNLCCHQMKGKMGKWKSKESLVGDARTRLTGFLNSLSRVNSRSKISTVKFLWELWDSRLQIPVTFLSQPVQVPSQFSGKTSAPRIETKPSDKTLNSAGVTGKEQVVKPSPVVVQLESDSEGESNSDEPKKLEEVGPVEELDVHHDNDEEGVRSDEEKQIGLEEDLDIEVKEEVQDQDPLGMKDDEPKEEEDDTKPEDDEIHEGFPASSNEDENEVVEVDSEGDNVELLPENPSKRWKLNPKDDVGTGSRTSPDQEKAKENEWKTNSPKRKSLRKKSQTSSSKFVERWKDWRQRHDKAVIKKAMQIIATSVKRERSDQSSTLVEASTSVEIRPTAPVSLMFAKTLNFESKLTPKTKSRTGNRGVKLVTLKSGIVTTELDPNIKMEEKKKANKEKVVPKSQIAELSPRQSCPFCAGRILPEDMPSHMEAHVGENYFVCPRDDCNFCFISSWSPEFWQHLELRRACWAAAGAPALKGGTINIICETCDAMVDRSKILKHLKEHETDEKQFECPMKYCSKKFSQKQMMTCHLRSHVVDPKTLQTCALCPVLNELDYRILGDHLKLFHKIQDIYECKYCTLVSHDSADFVKHIRSHVCSRGDLTKVKCHICGVALCTADEVSNHYFDSHGLGVKHFCKASGCDFSSFSINMMSKHRVIHDKKEYPFRCQKCSPPQHFKSLYSLGLHEKVVHGVKSKTSKCIICNKSFRSLEQHNRSAHSQLERSVSLAKAYLSGPPKDQISYCQFCDAELDDGQHFVDHSVTHLDQLVTCQICEENEEEFVDENALRKHYFIVHRIGRAFFCKNEGCRFYCLKKEEIVSHRNTVHPNTRKLTTAKLLALLPHNGEGGGTPKFVCELCSSRVEFSSEGSLKDHQVESHGAELTDKSWKCKICQKTFSKKHHYFVHYRALHLPIFEREVYQCEKCEASFFNRRSLQKHDELVHCNLRLICELCGKVCKYTEEFKRHMRYQHKLKNKLFECETCKKTFKLRSSLREHEKSKHSPEGECAKVKPKTVCNICGAEVAKIREHLKYVHSNTRFKCDQCEKTFKSPKGLKSHVEKEHEGLRHTCPECQKEFKDINNLKDHLRIHSGLKPYVCDVCGLAFRIAGSLSKHKKRMHSEKV